MRISADDRARVCAAIRAAEEATAAEFVCVLIRNASQYRFYPLAWAVLASLVSPWLFLALTEWSFMAILLGQLVVFAVLLPFLSWPRVRRWIVPRGIQRAVAHRAAAEQFLIRGLANTPHRRGVLLFVAEEEHYARVLADDGIATEIPHSLWLEAVTKLVESARTGRHADGFVAALTQCTTVIAARFPAEAAGTRVLPDRFYIIE